MGWTPIHMELPHRTNILSRIKSPGTNLHKMYATKQLLHPLQVTQTWCWMQLKCISISMIVWFFLNFLSINCLWPTKDGLANLPGPNHKLPTSTYQQKVASERSARGEMSLSWKKSTFSCSIWSQAILELVLILRSRTKKPCEFCKFLRWYFFLDAYQKYHDGNALWAPIVGCILCLGLHHYACHVCLVLGFNFVFFGKINDHSNRWW